MLYSSNEVVFSAGAVVFDAAGTRVLTIAFTGNKGDKVVVFPKGRVEEGESLKDAACREVEEETGVVCKLWPCGLVGLETRYSEEVQKTKVVYWYAASIVETREQHQEDKWMVPTWIHVADASNVLTRDDDRRLLELCWIQKQKAV
ncbi:hypothetical protein H4R20_003302 [Coemansia guatemalensis]|uniref:Nudix hydrolase domain-containing protein n=1 Tax=Coemansia guatemalensis TaxID=2761395 RepID=A0A9W8HTY7_9FUNG|nr:hypothetical protein H4R20_003302 [Coemansia guatemalensis]